MDIILFPNRPPRRYLFSYLHHSFLSDQPISLELLELPHTSDANVIAQAAISWVKGRVTSLNFLPFQGENTTSWAAWSFERVRNFTLLTSSVWWQRMGSKNNYMRFNLQDFLISTATRSLVTRKLTPQSCLCLGQLHRWMYLFENFPWFSRLRNHFEKWRSRSALR